MQSVVVALGIVAVASSLVACGGGSFPAAGTTTTPRSTPSSVDPITGLPREVPRQPFVSGNAEHLCSSSEEVVFACTLEGPPPQAVTSFCLKKGSPRNDPVVAGRERADGRIEEPFAGKPSQLMIMVLEAGDIPFSVELEQRAEGGAFGVEKQTDPKASGKSPRYRRSMTVGKGEGAKTTHARCDPAHPVTDNFDAMRAYKL